MSKTDPQQMWEATSSHLALRCIRVSALGPSCSRHHGIVEGPKGVQHRPGRRPGCGNQVGQAQRVLAGLGGCVIFIAPRADGVVAYGDVGAVADIICCLAVGAVSCCVAATEREGEELPVELRLVSPPKPGHTLRVLVYDPNPIDTFHSTDELRFRSKRYAVGYQTGSSYVVDIDTSDPFEKEVPMWERPCIRFYRDYGEAGYRRKAILRFDWLSEPLMVTGKSRRKLVQLKISGRHGVPGVEF